MLSQTIRLLVVATASWYLMMVCHEAGHCISAWLSGGSVASVSIPLFGFSQTHHAENPHPLFVTWAGPIGGALVGLVCLIVARWCQRRVRHATLFFGGFSLIANGMYIGVGGFYNAGDGAVLLQHTARLWHLVAFGVVATGLGIYGWHRMGSVTGWFAEDGTTPDKEAR